MSVWIGPSLLVTVKQEKGERGHGFDDRVHSNDIIQQMSAIYIQHYGPMLAVAF